jgi:enamine deaminase RidA (YjgF/YER057c/UK114 family)
MERTVVPSAPPWAPIVGYSRAIRTGPFVFVAGTTAATEHGGVVGGADVAAQTREALERIVAALRAVGAGVEHVVRTRMFVTDISRWAEVGRVHGEFFADVTPVATMVQVSALIDPGLLVEIEADAVVTDAIVTDAIG